MQTIYLAGPVNGCTDEEARGWRELAMRELRGLYHFRDPMARDYRGRERHNVTAIVAGDEADIDAADVLLVSAERPTWGTAMEVRDAFRWKGKHVVAFGAGRDPSPWVVGNCHLLTPSIRAALDYLKGRADTFIVQGA